jgi:hypothetical protein
MYSSRLPILLLIMSLLLILWIGPTWSFDYDRAWTLFLLWSFACWWYYHNLIFNNIKF